MIDICFKKYKKKPTLENPTKPQKKNSIIDY